MATVSLLMKASGSFGSSSLSSGFFALRTLSPSTFSSSSTLLLTSTSWFSTLSLISQQSTSTSTSTSSTSPFSNDALSSSTAITPLSSGGGLIETRRNLRFAGRKQINRGPPHPFTDSLGKLPFQNFFLEAPGIPTNSKNYNDWKIYLAQQIRNVRYFVGEFGMNIKSLREFKAEAADLYRQYYEAIAAGDLSKLSKIIPSDKVYDFKPVLEGQSGVTRTWRLTSDIKPIKLLGLVHVDQAVGRIKFNSKHAMVRFTSTQESDVYVEDSKTKEWKLLKKIGPKQVTETIIFEKDLKKPVAEQRWKIVGPIEAKDTNPRWQ